MKTSLFTLSCMLITCLTFGQNNSYTFDPFTANLDNSLLKVTDKRGSLIFEKKFANPSCESMDLDNDGVNEFLVINSYKKGWKTFYTLYIFNTIDSFFIADSVNSGMLEPYITGSKEIEGEVIISGNQDFDRFNNDSTKVFLPINCWKYENGDVYIVNSDIYNLFISENEGIIDFIDDYYYSNSKDCSNLKNVISAIAAGYANYINAGDRSIAGKFLNKYYSCDDINRFKNELNNLLK